MRLQLASGPRISSIKLDRKGRRLLASCSDRVLRVAEVAAPSQQQRQQAFPAEQALSRARLVSRVSLLSLHPQARAHAASMEQQHRASAWNQSCLPGMCPPIWETALL